MAKLNISKNLQNNLVVIGLISILVLVLFGVSQVVLRNVRGDRASATVSSVYLSQIGLSTVDPNPNGGFDDSKKICQSNDGFCQEDGLIDYEFNTLVEKTNLTEAFDPNIANSTNGGLILTKSNNLFNQNGTITSKNYIPKSGKNISINKIQIGVGLKPENLISLGYSLDSGANFTTAIGNFTYDQLKSQENQTVIEYNFTTPAQVSQGFAYKIALKADSSLKKSPSLKYVRVFYTVTAANTNTDTETDTPLTDYSTTRITAQNIGNGTCTPATIQLGATTTCTWRLENGPAGTVYYINALPNETPATGSTNLIGALIHSQASSQSVLSLNGVKTPSEISNFQTDNNSYGTCTVSEGNLVCANIKASGNLTAGEKFVDIVFHGSTPPIPGQNEFYGTPAITINKARVTLTSNESVNPSTPFLPLPEGNNGGATPDNISTSNAGSVDTSNSTSTFLPLPNSDTSGTAPKN